jgi:AraC family transcriptional activator of pobA
MMENTGLLLGIYRQNHKLPVRIITPAFGQLPAKIAGTYSLTQRKTFYFFLFLIDGNTQRSVDLQHFELKKRPAVYPAASNAYRFRQQTWKRLLDDKV